jgi:hypothetical protein
MNKEIIREYCRTLHECSFCIFVHSMSSEEQLQRT